MTICQSKYYNVEFMEAVLNIFGIGGIGLQQSFRVYKLYFDFIGEM
jgi:hypothetical protein